ncbi:MAG: hypothetical protein M4579_003766, partial [Chaenotheca gracillima]
HKERHTARGSQLQRKDAYLQSANQSLNQKSEGNEPLSAKSLGEQSHGMSGQPFDTHVIQRKTSLPHSIYIPGDAKSNVFSPQSATSSATLPGSASPQGRRVGDMNLKIEHRSSISSTADSVMTTPKRSNSDTSALTKEDPERYDPSGGFRNVPMSNYGPNQRHQSFGSAEGVRHQSFGSGNVASSMRPSVQTSNDALNIGHLSLASPYQASPTVSMAHTGAPQFSQQTSVNSNYPPSRGTYVNQQGVPSFALPPPGYATQNSGSSSRADINMASSAPMSMSVTENQSVAMDGSMAQAPINDTTMYDPMGTPWFTPFGDGLHGLNRSPFAAIRDDFTSWLFSESQNNNQNQSPMDRQAQARQDHQYDYLYGAPFQPTFLGGEVPMVDLYPHMIPQQHPMAVTSILDTSLPESVLSEDKRASLIELIKSRFNERNHAPVKEQKEAILDGSIDEDAHVLSLRMMQTYISSFWYHFHPQLPILHKPTFVPDKTQNLLLLAMMAIGASCLDKMHGHEVTQKCAELSMFLAWHLRSEIFNDADFIPPAKLWVFQALLLLEIYEKMYASRALHERAHIHHATTITLMRRGSSLIGRSALDSPPSTSEEKSNHSANGSESNHRQSPTPDKWWSRWIKTEATRRVAFAAFAIDATHATMFGHSAVMIAHEMGQQRLPCDEALWSATTSAEVARTEASLRENGVRPILFLMGLKRILSGEGVRTNSFGRTILMAGLLSVSWHMNQKDLQINSLGVQQAVGGRDKWKKPLTRAYDRWKEDFDQSLAQSSDPAMSGTGHFTKGSHEDNVFESRTVLHHLAHMAMHVDVVDCQIYAGAARLLGRAITVQDYEKTQKRMKSWAPSAQARDATFYALRFLSEVLLADRSQTQSGSSIHSPTQFIEEQEYSARDDFLINRPWVLYFAALIVWSYGYALDGPIVEPVPKVTTMAEKHQDMCAFLQRVGGVETPEQLINIQGRNNCLGMLMVLHDAMRKTRWELLHEAANLVTKCVEKLTPSHPPQYS